MCPEDRKGGIFFIWEETISHLVYNSNKGFAPTNDFDFISYFIGHDCISLCEDFNVK